MSRLHVSIAQVVDAFRLPIGHSVHIPADEFGQGQHVPQAKIRIELTRLDADTIAIGRLGGGAPVHVTREDIANAGGDYDETLAKLKALDREKLEETAMDAIGEVGRALRHVREQGEEIARVKQAIADTEGAIEGTKAAAEQRFGELGEMHRAELEASKTALADALAEVASLKVQLLDVKEAHAQAIGLNVEGTPKVDAPTSPAASSEPPAGTPTGLPASADEPHADGPSSKPQG